MAPAKRKTTRPATRTAPGTQVRNTIQHQDSVIILFDTPFAPDDEPGRDRFLLAWTGDSGKRTRDATRSTLETVDATHQAIRFTGLKPGYYELVRQDRGAPSQRIFADVPARFFELWGVDVTFGLANAGEKPARHVPHRWYWVSSKPPHAADQDLRGAVIDYAKIPVDDPDPGASK